MSHRSYYCRHNEISIQGRIGLPSIIVRCLCGTTLTQRLHSQWRKSGTPRELTTDLSWRHEWQICTISIECSLATRLNFNIASTIKERRLKLQDTNKKIFYTPRHRTVKYSSVMIDGSLAAFENNATKQSDGILSSTLRNALSPSSLY